MENFTPWSSLLGGGLIGLSASLMLLLHGRIAGITGIVGGAVDPGTASGERAWRWLFIAGLLSGALILLPFSPQKFELDLERSHVLLIVAGVLVGLGTRLGSGCTSGHGVCGISRGSARSLTATATFITTGVLTVIVTRLWGGAQ